MSPVYDYVCRACGAATTLDRLPAEGADMRHLKEDGTVCGTFRRLWQVNINIANLKAARG